MGMGVKIPMVGSSIYTMGIGNKISNFQKNINFLKSSKFQKKNKISKKI